MKKRQRYSKEFKLDAVRLVTEQGYSIAAAASPVAPERPGSMMPLAHQSYGALLTIATSFAPIIKSQRQIPISPMLAGKPAKVEIPVSP